MGDAGMTSEKRLGAESDLSIQMLQDVLCEQPQTNKKNYFTTLTKEFPIFILLEITVLTYISNMRHVEILKKKNCWFPWHWTRTPLSTIVHSDQNCNRKYGTVPKISINVHFHHVEVISESEHIKLRWKRSILSFTYQSSSTSTWKRGFLNMQGKCPQLFDHLFWIEQKIVREVLLHPCGSFDDPSRPKTLFWFKKVHFTLINKFIDNLLATALKQSMLLMIDFDSLIVMSFLKLSAIENVRKISLLWKLNFLE
jgi:hypothetical protein